MPIHAIIFSVLMSMLLFTQGALVSVARSKYNVPTPRTEGDENFMRYFRVHYNTIERLVMIMPLLWISSIYANPLYAGIAGYIWVFARVVYSIGYYKKASLRTPGMLLGVLPEIFLLGLAISTIF